MNFNKETYFSVGFFVSLRKKDMLNCLQNRVARVPNPIGAALVIDNLQNLLGGMQYLNTATNTMNNWLDHVLPLAIKQADTNMPIISADNNDYHPAINDLFKSVCFFYLHDPAIHKEGNATIYDISLIVWFNRNFIDKADNVKDWFIESIRKVLIDFATVKELQIFYNFDTVWSDFVSKEREKQRTEMSYKPNDSFRIRFKIAGDFVCQTTFQTIANIPC